MFFVYLTNLCRNAGGNVHLGKTLWNSLKNRTTIQGTLFSVKFLNIVRGVFGGPTQSNMPLTIFAKKFHRRPKVLNSEKLSNSG